MGCRNTFEFRREELGLLRQVPAAQVTDDDVFESYRNMGEVPRG